MNVDVDSSFLCYAVIMHNTIHERNLSLTLRSLISHTIASMVYSAYSAHMCIM